MGGVRMRATNAGFSNSSRGVEMDQFPFLKECLRKFNYPNIHSLDDMEIADIFSNGNRHFLVSWILKQIDNDYNEIVENTSKDDLAEILHHNGFCTKPEKIPFMNGECDSTTQFEILYNMFEYMNSLSDEEDRDEMKPFSEHEVTNVIEFDLNLFPEYGNKQTLTHVQREKKMNEYQEEIEQLKTLTDSKSKRTETEPLTDTTNLKHELSNTLRDVETNLCEFKKNALHLIKNKSCVGDGNVKFKENLSQTLEESRKQAAVISDFIENMNVLLNFKKSNVDVKYDNSSKNRTILREISGLCNKVVAASKRNN